MADASTEPKLTQTETEKPLHGDEKATEAPKETSEAPGTVRPLPISSASL
jgi:Ran-binding protein 1